MAGSQGGAIAPWGRGLAPSVANLSLGSCGLGLSLPGAWVPAPSLSWGVSCPTCRAPADDHPLPDAGCLPWIVERLLEGNSLTFLLLCVTLPGSPWDRDAASGCPLPEVSPIPPHAWHSVPGRCPGIPAVIGSRTPAPLIPISPDPVPGTGMSPWWWTPCGPCPGLAALPDPSGEEILAALGLAERVKGLAKTISATLWDPAQEVAARRREIRGLRMELLAGAGLPEQKMAVAQLRRALRELQVGERPWPPDGTRMALIPPGRMRSGLRPGVKTLVQH